MEKTISFAITKIYKDFLNFSANKLKESGISFGQIGFVIYIGKNKGCSLSEIKQNLKVDWGHAQRVIDKLIANGFIEKKKDKDDKRIFHLSLTEKGEKAYELSHDVFFLYDETKLKALTKAEKEDLCNLLNKIKEDD